MRPHSRRLAGILLAIALSVAIPAHAFTATLEADGSTTYFFAYPSLRIESSTALDFTGLQRIEAVAGGVLARGTFELLATAADAVGLLGSDGALWTGHSDATGHLDILAGGNLNLGTATLAGFQYITLFSGGSLALNGSVEMAGGAVSLVGRTDFPSTGMITAIGSGGDIIIGSGGDITLLAPLAIPEPGTWVLLAAGLVVLGAVARRKRNDAFSVG